MAQMKSFFDLVNELSMKSDKKLPNLKVPVKGKKGVSKFSRKKAIGQAKDDLNAGFKTDANRKAAFAKMNDSVHSADKKPEKYRKPDGKMGIRMVPIDKEVIKKEASVLKPTKPTDIIKHAKTLAKNPRDYMMNKKKYLDKARAKVFRMYPREAINHDDAHRDAQTHSDGSMSVKKIPSMIKKPGDKHLHLHMKSYHKEKDGQDFAKKHGYKVKNYVKTPSGTRMDIHKEMVDPMDLRGRPKKKDPNPESPYGMKHPLHPANIAKKKAKANVKQSNPDKYEPTFKEAKSFQYFDNKDDAHAHAKKHGGRVFVNTGKGNTKVKGKRINTHVVIKREEVEVDEALTMKQRMDKRRIMKRNKARIAIGRKRAKKKMANMKVIKKRSDRQARNEIAKKLMRGIPKRELSPARKRALEKRLESPALKQRIKRLSKRMFKDVRKKEVMRKKG